jgi:hypothetical protein
LNVYLTHAATRIIIMLYLSKPATQARLNAAVAEVIGLNVLGPVGIPWGCCAARDADGVVQYTETRMKQRMKPVFQGDALHFHINNKQVCFTEWGVVIQPAAMIPITQTPACTYSALRAQAF